jgi:hypothetical protein
MYLLINAHLDWVGALFKWFVYTKGDMLLTLMKFAFLLYDTFSVLLHIN